MYQTSRTSNILPEFQHYAEKHGLFQLFQRCISTLLINRPENPIEYLIHLLKKDSDVPKIIILGLPGTNHHTIAKMLQKTLQTILIESNDLLQNIPNQLKDTLSSNLNTSWIELYEKRLKGMDCRRRGWILIDFPFNCDQASALKMKDINPKHVVYLDASDDVLIEHVITMRTNLLTKPFQSKEYDEKNMMIHLEEYRKNINEIKDHFQSILHTVNADQPLNDIFTEVYSYTMKKPCSMTSFTQRIIILGPTGSGRKTLAMKISQKYNLPIVSIPTLIKQEIANQTSIGISMKSYVDRQLLVPNNLLMQIIRKHLNENKSWIMIGFPRTIEQAENLLQSINLTPNKIIFLDISLDIILKRLSQSSTDFNEIIRKHYEAYMIYLNDLKDFYSHYDAIDISSNQDISIIFEFVETNFINPILK